jgi:hypothetical protein
MDEMCVCLFQSLCCFSELSSSALFILYFIWLWFEWCLRGCGCGRCDWRIGNQSGAGFLWTEMMCRLYYTIWGKTE